MRFRLPPSSKSQQYRAIIPPGMKRLYFVTLILFAIATGRSQWQIHASEITTQASVLPASVHLATAKAQATTTSPLQQFAVLAIGKEKFVAPTEAQPAVITRHDSASIGGAQSLLQALNAYRQKNGKPPLQWDGKLAAFSQQRADFFNQQNDLDGHAGFTDMMNNHDGFHSLGFWTLGENSAIGQHVSAQELIENVYGKSPGHNANELNPDYSYVGIGVNGTATNFIFGGRKM